MRGSTTVPTWSVPIPDVVAKVGDDVPRVTADSPDERAWKPAYIAPRQ